MVTQISLYREGYKFLGLIAKNRHKTTHNDNIEEHSIGFKQEIQTISEYLSGKRTRKVNKNLYFEKVSNFGFTSFRENKRAAGTGRSSKVNSALIHFRFRSNTPVSLDTRNR